MAQIAHYRDRFKTSIKICVKCNFVDEMTDNTMNCPSCGVPNHLGFFETPAKFQRFVQLYMPKNIRSDSEHLQYIIDEVLGENQVI